MRMREPVGEFDLLKNDKNPDYIETREFLFCSFLFFSLFFFCPLCHDPLGVGDYLDSAVMNQTKTR